MGKASRKAALTRRAERCCELMGETEKALNVWVDGVAFSKTGMEKAEAVMGIGGVMN